MPTTMLTLAWLLFATTSFAANPVEPQPVATTAQATVAATDSLVLVGLTGKTEQDQFGWLLFESEDEETDDNEEAAVGSLPQGWLDRPSPFGVAASNPHPTILPRSALRLSVLRC